MEGLPLTEGNAMHGPTWACWALLVTALWPTAAPVQLICLAAEAEVGTVKSGQPLTHTFTVVNRGPGAVEMIGTLTSCGCVAPLVGERVLAPGQETTVRVEINTLVQAVGPQSWTVTLHSRPVAQAEADDALTLTVRGSVVAEVRIEPTTLILAADAPVPATLTLTDIRPQPLRLLAVRTTLPSLRADLDEAKQDGAGKAVRTVRLTVRPDCPPGRHEAIVSLHTDDPAYADLRVPVTVLKSDRHSVRDSRGGHIDCAGRRPDPGAPGP